MKGGVIVHLGCGEGSLTTALRIDDRRIVHGLDRDPHKVAAARRNMQARDLCGAVSVDVWEGNALHHTQNLVNPIIAQERTTVDMQELMRVPAPRAVARRTFVGNFVDKAHDKVGMRPPPPCGTPTERNTHALHTSRAIAGGSSGRRTAAGGGCRRGGSCRTGG